MVPAPVTTQDVAEAPDPVEVRRVGPGGSMAPDNAFAVALLSLWHRVAQTGGAVGFPPTVDRPALGSAVALVIADLRSGRAQGFALTRKRDVVGFGMLEPGTGTSGHTGEIRMIMVHPNSQAAGLGTDLMRTLLRSAATLQLDRIRLSFPAGRRLQKFFDGFGFVEAGRSPGWVRLETGEHDELLMTLRLVAERGTSER